MTRGGREGEKIHWTKIEQGSQKVASRIEGRGILLMMVKWQRVGNGRKGKGKCKDTEMVKASMKEKREGMNENDQ